MHGRDSEVFLLHHLSQLDDSLLGVAVNECLVDVQVSVQVEQDVHLPLFLLNGYVVLLDTFESELFVLDQDLRGVSQELSSQLEDFEGHGSREQGDLDVAWQELEDVLDLGLESSGEHLVSLVQDEHLHVVGLQESLLHHVLHSTWGADNNVDTFFEDLDVFSDDGSSDTSVDLDAHELSDGLNDVGNLLGELSGGGDDQGLGVHGCSVDDLQQGNGEASSLTST